MPSDRRRRPTRAVPVAIARRGRSNHPVTRCERRISPRSTRPGGSHRLRSIFHRPDPRPTHRRATIGDQSADAFPSSSPRRTTTDVPQEGGRHGFRPLREGRRQGLQGGWQEGCRDRGRRGHLRPHLLLHPHAILRRQHQAARSRHGGHERRARPRGPRGAQGLLRPHLQAHHLREREGGRHRHGRLRRRGHEGQAQRHRLDEGGLRNRTRRRRRRRPRRRLHRRLGHLHRGRGQGELLLPQDEGQHPLRRHRLPPRQGPLPG